MEKLKEASPTRCLVRNSQAEVYPRVTLEQVEDTFWHQFITHSKMKLQEMNAPIYRSNWLDLEEKKGGKFKLSFPSCSIDRCHTKWIKCHLCTHALHI